MPTFSTHTDTPMAGTPMAGAAIVGARRPSTSMAIVAAVWLSFLLAGCNPFSTTPPTTVPPDRRTPNATVNYVIDGDTIVVAIGDTEEHVRLIGIDTPEIEHAESTKSADCFGPEATDYTRSLLPEGTAIHLQRDIEARDDYGRLLGYVYRADDGVFVNYEIVRNGYAQPLSIAPNTTYQRLFATAASEANDSDLGLWGAC